jgi:glucose/arabinose dehydrogenase
MRFSLKCDGESSQGRQSQSGVESMRLDLGTSVCCLILCGIVATPSNAQTFAERIVGGFDTPTFATHAPGDTTRLFVARIWHGDIQVVDLNSNTILAQPFLAINDLPDPLFNEQGLLGLAFDPDYATNGYFYVNYTGADNSLNVRRFRVQGDPAISSVADPTSGHTILRIPKEPNWHNGGWIGFGPNDGYLYITTGDPGGGQAQLIESNLHGKVLRIDIRSDAFPADPTRNYSIPPSNPFVAREGLDEIWAYGLRNPWRASFDRETGNLWINDVGELAREEVNLQPPESSGGENYGWPHREGTISTSWPGPPITGYVDPIYDYSRDNPDPLMAGAIVAASGLYRGPVPSLVGHYLFTDFASGNIWQIDPDADDPRSTVTNINQRLAPNSGTIHAIAAFGEDADGNLYLMDHGFGDAGEVFRVATTSRRAVWNGSDAAAGAAGDGTAWSDPRNWTRNGLVDAAFAEHDDVIFAAGASPATINLGVDHTAAAIRFGGTHTLEGNTLRLMSGNVHVDDGAIAIVRSYLVAETANHSIRKLGGGMLVVEGNAGQIAVKEGTLGGRGVVAHLTVHAGAVAAPGGPIATTGILTVNQSFALHNGATLALEIGGRTSSDPQIPQYDQVAVGGPARLNGTLSVDFIDLGAGEFAPTNGDAFAIVSATGGLSGAFEQLDLPPLPPNLAWQTFERDSTLFLAVTAQLPGDYDASGTVDAADYVVWRKTFGQTGARPVADGTGPAGVPDGIVDELDYQFWRVNFGNALSGSPPSLSVPEPERFAIYALAVCMVACRLRRHEHARVDHLGDSRGGFFQVCPRVAV